MQAGSVSAASDVDSYFDRLIKYIPSDIVAAWIFISSIFKASKSTPSQPGLLTLWITFFVGIAFTALWTWFQTDKPAFPKPVAQTVITTIAFAVWAYALGGPFPEWIPGFYKPVTGSLILVGYTLLVARFVPK